jgi:hypothetical protein
VREVPLVSVFGAAGEEQQTGDRGQMFHVALR